MTAEMAPWQTVPPPDWLAQVGIRLVRAADLEALEWEGEYAHFRRMYAEIYARTQAGQAAMWLAELAGVGIIGQVFVQFGRPQPGPRQMYPAYVHGFRVRPAYRGRGVGTRLMDALEDDLRRRGVRQVTLNVVAENSGGRRFYEARKYFVTAPDPGRWTYVDQHGNTQAVDEPGWRMRKVLQ